MNVRALANEILPEAHHNVTKPLGDIFVFLKHVVFLLVLVFCLILDEALLTIIMIERMRDVVIKGYKQLRGK